MAIYQGEYTAQGQRFLLRNARGEDAQKEIDFTERTALETEHGTWMPGEYAQQFGAEDEAAYLDSTAEDAGALYLLAWTEDGKLVGCCSVSFATRKARVRHLGDISICVAKDCWGMGLGRRMMEIGMTWAKAQGVEIMELLTDTDNLRALGLYLGLGFQVDGRLPKRWKNPRGEFQDLYAMSKEL